ncbi:diguanylate cyclase [Alkalimonas delamerensis]|uniref:diguanylate cyclase n=1 Tax=Alkalimonas delamerensis TaxID=265981 RepID=A0ABT9GLP8_9GAMM|nr:diguanylate cyclase [Alkalimonas delamerensis]MDP4527893.1 diguanylate cyclase [Alkalimonas delamerensis]
MSSENKNNTHQQRFAALQQRFIETLPSKTAMMEEQYQKLVAGEQAAFTELIAISHQLSGSCGTFRLTELGQQAREVEQLALSMQREQRLEAARLSELEKAVAAFHHHMQQVLAAGDAVSESQAITRLAPEQIWLLLDNNDLTAELTNQLSAFGYPLQMFTSYQDCLESLASQSPALLYCSASLDDGVSQLFEQQQLLKVMQDRQIPWMLFSDQDNFSLRVQAARYQAQAFYVSPLDVPAMLGRISDLAEQQAESGGRVCVMDDDALLAEHFALTLQTAGIDCQLLTSPESLIADILQYQPDLVLLDLHMPTYSGPELAGVIRQYDTLKSLPIVYLSAEQDKAQQLKAMAFGADDFLTKPISDAQLVKAVQVRLRRSRELKNLIVKDSLTGLMKHSAIKEAAVLEYQRAKRSGNTFCLVMVDIDHFKSVNDRFGHAMGDLVITTLATLLQKRIRRTDKAGRYGGEEFLLVLPECASEDALQLMQSILDSFNTIVFHSSAQDFACSFSAGIACSSQGFDDAESMLAQADEKLYQAKSLGRNRVLA